MYYTLYYLLKNNGTLAGAKQLSSRKMCYADLFFVDEKIFSLGEREKTYFITLRSIAENNINIGLDILDSVYFLAAHNIPVSVIDNIYKHNIKTLTEFKNEAFKYRSQIGISNKVFETILSACDKIKISEYEKFMALTFYWIFNNNDEAIDSYYRFLFRYLNTEKVYYFLGEELGNGHLTLEDNTVKFAKKSIKNFINYNNEEINILKERLNGDTLQQIGDRRNLTRERIRQKITKIFQLIGDLKEDQYQTVFEKYDMSLDDFKTLYHEDESTYYYLNNKYTRGNLPVFKIFDEYQFKDTSKNALLTAKNLMVNSHNETTTLNLINLFSECMYKNKNKNFDEKSIEKKFYELLYTYNPEYRGRTVALRGIIERCTCIIFSNSNQFRYFECQITDKIINKINQITDLRPGIYGASKIYNDNKKLMKQLDLRNSYEFCDFCTKFVGVTNLKFIKKIHRRTEIQIREISKIDFIQTILYMNIDCKVRDVVNDLEKKYGLNQSSILTYIRLKFPEAITNQHIKLVRNIDLAERITEYINENFDKDLYGLDAFNQQIRNHFNNDSIHVHNQLLEETNYRIGNEFVYSNKYSSHQEALQQYLISLHKFNFKTLELPKTSTLYNAVRKLELEFKIFKLDDQVFVSEEWLSQYGIRIQEIKDYVANVEDFTKNMDIFTLDSIINQGFHDNLLKYQLNTVFYERLITTIKNISWIRSKPIIFSYSKNHVSIDDVVKYYIDEEITDIETLYDILNNQMNLNVAKSTISSILIKK